MVNLYSNMLVYIGSILTNTALSLHDATATAAARTLVQAGRCEAA
jgi:hypothetical protein